MEKGFAEADRIFEQEYVVPKVQQAHIEPHVTLTYWDEDDRLVIRTSTQVPFHVRRQMAPVLGLPVKRITLRPREQGDDIVDIDCDPPLPRAQLLAKAELLGGVEGVVSVELAGPASA